MFRARPPDGVRWRSRRAGPPRCARRAPAAAAASRAAAASWPSSSSGHVEPPHLLVQRLRAGLAAHAQQRVQRVDAAAARRRPATASCSTPTSRRHLGQVVVQQLVQHAEPPVALQALHVEQQPVLAGRRRAGVAVGGSTAKPVRRRRRELRRDQRLVQQHRLDRLDQEAVHAGGAARPHRRLVGVRGQRDDGDVRTSARGCRGWRARCPGRPGPACAGPSAPRRMPSCALQLLQHRLAVLHLDHRWRAALRR